MKTSIIISAAIIGLSAIALAANEHPVIDNPAFYPGKFYGVIVNNNSNIILTQGEENSVRIEGGKESSQNIRTEIQDGVLVINGNNEPTNIYITVEEINMIEVNGTGKVFGMGTINSDILLLKVIGSGSMKVDVRTLKVAMVAKGDGKIIVSGSTGESFIKEYGKGKVYSDNLYSFSQTENHITSSIEKSAAVKL